MKANFILLLGALMLFSCITTKKTSPSSDVPLRSYGLSSNEEPPITQSLFNDKGSTISEADIRRILDGDYTLPRTLRVAIVRLDGQNSKRYYRSDEQYLKSQQAYLDLFSEKLRQCTRVSRISIVPDIMLPDSPSFTTIRESAVRMQADVIIVYAITSDIYSRYKVFSKADIKAFATTQLAVLDVRTGLIPFSSIVTRDFQAKRQEGELNDYETSNRVKNEAVLRTIEAIGAQLTTFLDKQR